MSAVPTAAANSWQVVSPGFNGTASRLVATYDPAAGGNAYVESRRPFGATHYAVTFWLDPSGINMPEDGTAVRFLNMIDDNTGGEPYAATIAVGFLRKRSADHQWHMTFQLYEDDLTYTGSGTDLALGTAFPVQIKIEFWRGGVGSTVWCVERVATPTSRQCGNQLDLEGADVDAVRFGIFNNGNPAGWTGSIAFDEIQSAW